MKEKGIDFKKYDKIYKREGVMTKGGGWKGSYGDDPTLDKKWDRYGHACEGKPNFSDVVGLQPKSMIDIGCGHNEFLGLIKKSYNDKISLLGVDIACPSADLIAPAHKIPIKNSSYDMLVSFDCMEHIPEEEVKPSYKEFARVADRIYIKISLTHSKTRIDEEPLHVCIKSKDWWLKASQQYFPNASIVRNDRPGTIWESITIYGDNRNNKKEDF